ncbi:hypothetical protein C8F04DRAFT_1349179 [Mycena alexandri]|uniref:Uncharacterized protein n=1 Tax=Mycena alexandri TaxID=1745969 RepID=A0AAD6RWE7_9AGAR|nr:hypothetical protein C8F04DRAFT_1349179 [Mycena alexandri]
MWHRKRSLAGFIQTPWVRTCSYHVHCRPPAMSSVRKIIDRGCRTPPTFHHLIAASLGKHYPLMDTDPGKPWLGGLAWAWDFEARSLSPRKPAFWLGLACAMLFVKASLSFVNLSRVSPLRLSKQAAAGASATQRLLVDGKIAIGLSAVFCMESMVVSAGKIGAKTDRTKKWIAGIFHNQDWERFESVVCLMFGEDLMYAQINNKKAVSFQSMISPSEAGSATKDPEVQFSKIAPADMFSPIVSTTPSKSRTGLSKASPFSTKTLLEHTVAAKKNCRSCLGSFGLISCPNHLK